MKLGKPIRTQLTYPRLTFKPLLYSSATPCTMMAFLGDIRDLSSLFNPPILLFFLAFLHSNMHRSDLLHYFFFISRLRLRQPHCLQTSFVSGTLLQGGSPYIKADRVSCYSEKSLVSCCRDTPNLGGKWLDRAGEFPGISPCTFVGCS